MSAASVNGFSSLYEQQQALDQDKKDLEKYFAEMRQLMDRIHRLLNDLLSLLSNPNPSAGMIAAILNDADGVLQEVGRIGKVADAECSAEQFQAVGDAVQKAASGGQYEVVSLLTQMLTVAKDEERQAGLQQLQQFLHYAEEIEEFVTKIAKLLSSEQQLDPSQIQQIVQSSQQIEQAAKPSQKNV